LDNWDDTRRIEYLQSVRSKLQGLPLLITALEHGTLADPYSRPDAIRRCVGELNAVIDSFVSE
jgi:hypothetical protein